jgi:hypothetical protein
MILAELTDKKIEIFISNYEKSGKDEGGKFTLVELRVEKSRRIKSPFPPAEVAKVIVLIARESDDGLVTYKEVWERFRPDSKWIGNGPRTETGRALGAVIAYCIDHGLPLLSALVVKADKRSHSDEAIVNIHNEARKLGVDVGNDPRAFVKTQQQEALKLVAEALPV